MGEQNGVNGVSPKKTIKFSHSTSSSDNNNISSNSNGNGNANNNFKSTSNESVTSAMTFDKQSGATRIGGVSGLFGFLFSPAGIVLMFVAVNYPWLKTLIVGSSTSLFPSPSPSSSPVMMNTKSTTSPSSAPTTTKKTGGSNIAGSGKKNEADLLLQNLSTGCKNNPFKRIFDRTCRQEIRQLRHAQKLEKMKKRKERQERRKRRQQQQLYPQTPANATVTASDDDDIYHPTTPPMTRTITTTTGTSSSQQIKIVNINTLECNNILSRECRQKKRLMQQMKEALN